MRAVLLKGHGGFEQLELARVPVPLPAAGQALVRVGAAGVNNTDINTRIGWYAKTSTAAGGWTGSAFHFPRIQGADAAGLIVAVGSDVEVARIGERVLIDPIIRRTDAGALRSVSYLGSECDGAFAEFLVVPAINAVRISTTLSDAELASFPCSYLAAENMLSRAQLRSGETLLVTGASGGVGTAAVQLARRRGATVLAIAGTGKADAVKALGASQVFDRDADLVARLGRDSVDVVADVAGGAQFPAFLELLRPFGRYAVAGAIAGAAVNLDLRVLYLKDLRLLGCTVPEPHVFADLVGYIERAEIKPVVARTFPLSEIVAAQQEFLRKRHAGKIVLTIGSSA